MKGRNMDLGEPQKIIEVEPVVVPDTVPDEFPGEAPVEPDRREKVPA